MKYEIPEAGGVWEHKAGDCPTHGVNIAFAKPYRSDELMRCVACLLLEPVDYEDDGPEVPLL